MRDKRMVCDRKKLYKAGKMLVTAGIFSIAMFSGSALTVRADTLNGTQKSGDATIKITTVDSLADTVATTDKVVNADSTTD
ncbi:KxYKxGKxW signal peptide domain-containing protein, partial [Leuconostoc litchii]|uniref:KxYKxGKxW signal peptide domain-containing protein n=1 Tax=Leuconostoc litchii TaxID=1981069 RepID=UPI001FCC7250